VRGALKAYDHDPIGVVLGHLKINRAITTQHDQFADSFLGNCRYRRRLRTSRQRGRRMTGIADHEPPQPLQNSLALALDSKRWMRVTPSQCSTRCGTDQPLRWSAR
jgi:hypothetical protein